MRRNFIVIYKMQGDTSGYDLEYIGNGLYKMCIGGNKKSTYKSILKRVNNLKFDECEITEIIDIMELK